MSGRVHGDSKQRGREGRTLRQPIPVDIMQDVARRSHGPTFAVVEHIDAIYRTRWSRYLSPGDTIPVQDRAVPNRISVARRQRLHPVEIGGCAARLGLPGGVTIVQDRTGIADSPGFRRVERGDAVEILAGRSAPFLCPYTSQRAAQYTVVLPHTPRLVPRTGDTNDITHGVINCPIRTIPVVDHGTRRDPAFVGVAHKDVGRESRDR
jgi:hypothetical protein